MAIVCGWGGSGDGVAVRGAVRAFLGFARVVMLIFGGLLSQDLCSSHVRCLLSSAAAGGRLLRRLIAELLCASRVTRAASPAATALMVRGLA